MNELSFSTSVFIIFIPLVIYLFTGNVDFGSGIWLLLPSKNRSARDKSIKDSMSPFWEINHVWLIIVLVTLFVFTPVLFEKLFTNSSVLFYVFVISLMLRGSAFAFSNYTSFPVNALGVWQNVFSLASLVCAFTFGMILEQAFFLSLDLQVKFDIKSFLAGLANIILCSLLAFVYRRLFRKCV